MNRPDSPRQNSAQDDQLVRLLAEREEAGRDSSDPTLAAAASELETLARELNGEPPDNPFETEPDCQNVLERVQSLADELAPADAGAEDSRDVSGDIEQERLGQYRLLEKLGEGGMGAVYRARHERLGKLVAIKILPQDRMEDPGAVARFNREMLAVGKLEHPNIVRAMDAGDVDGTHYLVMELVDGEDVGSLIRRRGPLPVAASCEIIRQASLGLQHAHEHGLVHRDIKPSNLIVTRDRRQESRVESGVDSASLWSLDSGLSTVKILDMGLALLEDAQIDAAELTSTGQIMGTLDYMAPEQGADTHSVDIRADIYSLGATLYKLLTGRAPFDTPELRSPVRKLMALATAEPTPVGRLRPDAPPELAELVHWMLSKSPGARPTPPGAVAHELARFSAGAELAELFEPIEDERVVGTLQLRRGPAETPTAPDAARSESLQETRIGPIVDELESIAQTKTIARPAASDVGRGVRKWMLAAGAVFAALLLATVIVIQTDRGDLVIEADPALAANLSVTVKRDGDVWDEFQIEPGVSTHRVRSGRISVELPAAAQDQFRLVPESDSLELSRDGRIVFRLERRPNVPRMTPEGPAVAPDDAALANRRAAEAFLKVPGAIVGLTDGSLLHTGDAVPKEPFEVRDLRAEAGLDVPLAEALAAVHHLHRLERLRVAGTGAPAEAFLSFRDLPNLTNASLVGTNIDQRGVAALVAAAPELQSVELSRSEADDGMLGSLAAARRLKVLRLENCARITDAGLQQLANLPELQVLHLNGTQATRVGLSALAGRVPLRMLKLGGSGIVADDLDVVAQFPDLHALYLDADQWDAENGSQLSHLDLQELQLFGGRPDLTPLSKLPSLRVLNVTAALEASDLQQIGEARGLETLTLHGRFSDDALEALYPLVKLLRLDMRDATNVTREGVARLHAALPRCRIDWYGGAIEPSAAGPVSARGLVFDGDDYVEFPDLPLKTDEPVTIEAWLTPQDVPPAKQAKPRVLNVAFLALQFSGDGTRWQADSSAEAAPGYRVFDADEPIEVGRSTHVAITWSGTELQWFVDGKRQRQHDFFTAQPSPDGLNYIGRIPTNAKAPGYRGEVHGVRVSRGLRYRSDFQPLPQWTPDDSTIALYRCDEGAGDVLKDASSNGYDGKIAGAAWDHAGSQETEGASASGLRLTAESRVEFPPLPLDVETPRTLELWVTLDRQPVRASYMPLVVDWDFQNLTFTGDGSRWMIYAPADPKARHFESDELVAPGRRTHLAMMWSEGELTLYVDGKLQSQHDHFTPVLDGKGVLGLGMPAPTSRFPSFEGVVHALRVSNVRRYRKNFDPAETFESDGDTLALYRFDEGEGDVLHDASGNGRDGKITAGTWVFGPTGDASSDGEGVGGEGAGDPAAMSPALDSGLEFDGVDDHDS